jgi:hypothetical protein
MMNNEELTVFKEAVNTLNGGTLSNWHASVVALHKEAVEVKDKILADPEHTKLISTPGVTEEPWRAIFRLLVFLEELENKTSTCMVKFTENEGTILTEDAFFESIRAQNKVICDIEQRYHLLRGALDAFDDGYEAGVLKSYEALKVWVTLP